MNATHLKIGRILGRKLYRKSCSVGNGIIYMVRRDSRQRVVLVVVHVISL